MVGVLAWRRGLGAATLVALSSSAACSGKVIDVGGSRPNDDGGEPAVAPIYATTAPPLDKDFGTQWKLVDKERRIANIVADGGQVFWVTERVGAAISSDVSPPQKMAIYGCAVANCEGSLQSLNRYATSHVYLSENILMNLPMAINQTGVFWQVPLAGGGAEYCSRNHCIAGQPLNPTPDSQIALTFAVDEKYFYFAADKRQSRRPDNTLARCEIENCAATASRLAMAAPAGETPYDGTSQIVPNGDYLYLNSGPRIIRTRKDGDSFEVIARDRPSEGVLAVRGESVFWSESPASSRILACPVSGCVGDARVVVSNSEPADNLTIDDEYVYFTHSVSSGWSPGQHWPPDRLLRCPIAGCAMPTVLAEGQGIEGPLVTDDDFVYFSGNGCRRANSSQTDTEPCSYIAAVRK